jgi:hypothetical protein
VFPGGDYYGHVMDSEGRLPVERDLRRRGLEAFDPKARAELLRVLELRDKDRGVQISRCFSDPRLQTMGEFLIDLEADPAARAIVAAELRIMNRQDGQEGQDPTP